MSRRLRKMSRDIFSQLKAAREAQGMSLADVGERAGMDRSAVFKLETGKQPNPTVDTLSRVAQAVGKKLNIELSDKDRP